MKKRRKSQKGMRDRGEWTVKKAGIGTGLTASFNSTKLFYYEPSKHDEKPFSCFIPAKSRLTRLRLHERLNRTPALLMLPKLFHTFL